MADDDPNLQIIISKTLQLLEKVQNNRNSGVSTNLKRFKGTLDDMLKIQNKVNVQSGQEVVIYSGLLQELQKLRKQIELQRGQSEKMLRQINLRISAFTKYHLKLIQDLKIERVKIEERLDEYMIGMANRWIEKGRNFRTLKQKQCSYFRQEIGKIKSEIEQFFNEATNEEKRIEQKIYKFVEQCNKILSEQFQQDIGVEVFRQMAITQQDIGNRIKKLADQRIKMQESALLLQKMSAI